MRTARDSRSMPVATLIVLLSALQYIPYFISIARGRTRPSVSAWSCFLLSLVVTILASLQTGSYSILITTGASLLCQLAIIIVGWRRGVAHMPDRTEKLILAAIALSVVLWWLANSPELAIVINLLIDLVATALVLKKLRVHPGSEAWATWLLGGLAAALACWHFRGSVDISYVYLLALFVSNLSVLGVLVWQMWRLRPFPGQASVR